MNDKLLSLVSLAFAAGMAFTVACQTQGGVPGIDSAHAADASSSACAAWEIATTYDDDYFSGCSTDAGCAMPDGWEPFTSLIPGNRSYLMLRRCTQWE
jgi:hypothetical protein